MTDELGPDEPTPVGPPPAWPEPAKELLPLAPVLNTDAEGLAIMPDTLLPPPVSPTGTPVIPQVLVRIAAAAVGVAGVLLTTIPPGTMAWKICSAVVAAGAMLGIASPGVRKTG